MNTHIAAKHKYYEDNKEAIIADLLSKGKAYTRRRWNIPRGSLGRLITTWLTKEQAAAIPISQPDPSLTSTEPPPDPANSAPSNGRLPPFPHFSEEWPQIVKVKWLEVYGELAKEST